MKFDRIGIRLQWFANAILIALLAVGQAAAQSAGSGTSLTYISGSSAKLEQVIGDCDWQVQAQNGTCKPTTSQTVTRFNILGNGQGGSFEHNGKMIFFFGDTISKDASAVNYHAADPVAWSTSTDPEAGLLLNFYTNSDGSPLFVKPPGIPMGPDAIPNAGISVNGQIYLVCNIGSDTSLSNPQSIDTSVLVQFDETAQSFTGGRTISQIGGHFIGTALHAFGTNVVMFGAGPYRGSDIYLQMTPASSFASGAGTQYFAGLVNGQPTWAGSESGAVPVVQDNPLNGPAWPNDSPSVGNLSVAYSSDVNLWLMTYDGGRQSNQTRGVYFTYAPQPWGPWATPQLIFNDVRDKAWGVYIHNPSIVPDPPGDGLNGPVIGSNDPYATPGGDFAPLMIERFTRVAGDTLKIYYNLSTWNPYTVVKMRSEFKIAPATPTPNYQGAWWAGQSENGWGLAFAQHGNTLVAGWYYYGANGQATWTIMPGCAWNAALTSCTGSLYNSTGAWLGSYSTASFNQSSVGTVTLSFTDANNGTMQYNVNGVSGTKTISRLSFGSGTAPSATNYSDVWWGGTDENGWGVALVQEQAVMAGSWYTYNKQGQPVWYLISGGSWTNATTYSAQLTSATGSPLIGTTYNPGLFVPAQAGSIVFTFSDANDATMSYTVDGVTQTKNISRLQF